MIEPLPQMPANVLGFKMSGKLHDEDYKTFVPLVDNAIAKDGKVRILAQFHDFHGWDAQALWDDIKFSTTHCTKIERIALVGEKAWEKGMAAVCKPFTMAKIRYFNPTSSPKPKPGWQKPRQQSEESRRFAASPMMVRICAGRLAVCQCPSGGECMLALRRRLHPRY